MVFPWRALEVVLLEAVFGQLFVFRSGTALVGIGIDADAASGGEESGHFDVFGVHEADEVLHDDVDAVLVEVTVVAEAEEIELQAFAFDHLLVGKIGNADFGKVGLPRDGAEAGEFGAVEAHPIVVVGVFVVEGFEHFGGIVALVFRLPAKSIEGEVFSHGGL